MPRPSQMGAKLQSVTPVTMAGSGAGVRPALSAAPIRGYARPGAARLREDASMHFQFAEIFGIAAALASLYAAHSKTMIPLRWAAIAANALAMVYSAMHGTWPTFALNAILLPTNAWRLYAMLRLIGDIDQALMSDMNAAWLLPYARPK